MVLLIIIPFLNGYFIGNIPNIFRQTHIYGSAGPPGPNDFDPLGIGSSEIQPENIPWTITHCHYAMYQKIPSAYVKIAIENDHL